MQARIPYLLRGSLDPTPGEYRVHTALLRMGIEVSPATCGRIMAANRQLYGLSPPQRAGRAKLEMPFKATRRREYWSIDVRYIEEHLLEDPRQVYVITVFENFSRMILSSKISPTQNQWDYLSVLADALLTRSPNLGAHPNVLFTEQHETPSRS